MKKNRLLAMFLATLLTSLTLPVLASPAKAEPAPVITDDQYGWKRIDTSVITILYPADGRQPMFFWWYKEEPHMIYVVKYEGLIEYFTFAEPFYLKRYEALAETFHERFFKPRWQLFRGDLRDTLLGIYEIWHPSYLPFGACKWELEEAGHFTDLNDPTHIIGYALAFKLVETRIPAFEFAENNVTIRCRLYYEPVTEVVKDDGNVLYEYDIAANEMKMDFIIDDWKWNIDVLRSLLEDLEIEDIEIPERESALALQINLASLNITKIVEAMIELTNIERLSTTSYMMVDHKPIFVAPNNTAQDEKPIVFSRHRRHVDIRFGINETTTLAGFFRFVPWAKNITEGQIDKMPVTASYIEAGSYMRLFLCYPKFKEKLDHDPSIGVEVPETTTPEATTPKYVVEAPSGSEIKPKVLGGISLPFVTTELVIVLVALVSVIAIAFFVAKWKGKVVNIVGVK